MPGRQILEDTKGAFVHVLNWASSQEEYEGKVRRWADGLFAFVEEIEGVEPFKNRTKKKEVDEEPWKLSRRAEREAKEVRFWTFHLLLPG
jgi:hypothetical protein